jgi:AcrR family transcriptional regulator
LFTVVTIYSLANGCKVREVSGVVTTRATTSDQGSGRRRNARGEGSRLAPEIVEGAIALIAREGGPHAVALRSVAREVGISAPSIYAHFPDREAILQAVVVVVFEKLRQRLDVAISAESDPVDRLVAGSRAYVAFGLENPGLYATLFSNERLGPEFEAPPKFPFDELPPVGGEGFALLVGGIRECVEAGVSSSTDVFADATAIWVALHGTVSLWSTLCRGPWPDDHDFVRRLVVVLARIDPKDSVV